MLNTLKAIPSSTAGEKQTFLTDGRAHGLYPFRCSPDSPQKGCIFMSNKKSNYHYNNPNTETLISGVKAIFKRLRRISVSKYGTRKRILEKTGNWQESPYIHSKVTLKSYLRICICYAIWVGENFPHVRSITYAYKAGCAHEYIQMCIDTGMSPYTIAQYRSALSAPMACIEYVVVHEFTHFLQPNHSRKFYEQLSMFLPDWQERKQLLDKNTEYSL